MDNKAQLFSSWLEELAERYGEKPAITCGDTLTFHKLWDASRRCSLALNTLGLQKGDKVVMWAYNSLDWIVAFFGVVMAGGVATLVNYSLNDREVTQITGIAGANWALLGDNRISVKNPAAAEQALAAGGVPMDHILSMKDLFKASMDDSGPFETDRFRALTAPIQPEDTQCIIFTTGTTALPKAVQLSSFSILVNAKARREFHSEDFLESCCVALPTFHSFGLLEIIIILGKGAHAYLAEKIKPELVLELIYRNRIELLTTVGAVCSAMASLPDFEEKLGGLLKICILGGGFTKATELIRVESLLGGGKVLMGYGMTESSSVIACNISADSQERRVESVGHVLPNIDARIWREGEGFVDPSEVGELVVKGPGVMNGYLGLPSEQQPVDADGWLHTGDLARFTEDGRLILAGRIKDIIVRKGEKISPMEVEQAILQEPSIREVKVLGAPHPTWGESVEACIVYSGAAPDEKALREALNTRLARFKIPSHFFAYSAFPLNTNGKLDQRRLKESMLEKLKEVSENA